MVDISMPGLVIKFQLIRVRKDVTDIRLELFLPLLLLLTASLKV
jgi:hypothetical protein